ncbi:hypothetical protein GGQ58_003901 [Paracoccus denitrificans]|nr:hypothetical protein [Paracoccus denitrificans]
MFPHSTFTEALEWTMPCISLLNAATLTGTR